MSKGLDKTALDIEAQATQAGSTTGGRSFTAAIGIFRGAGKILGFRANLVLLRPIEELTVPLDAVTPTFDRA